MQTGTALSLESDSIQEQELGGGGVLMAWEELGGGGGLCPGCVSVSGSLDLVDRALDIGQQSCASSSSPPPPTTHAPG